MTLQNLLAFTGTSAIQIAEWFAASVAIVIVVTLMYAYVLNRSPPPEGLTVEKVERSKSLELGGLSSRESLEQARHALDGNEYAVAVKLAVHSATEDLSSMLASAGADVIDMNVSDLGYLIETRARAPLQISQPSYQLNALRLKAVQGQPITKQEAEWAVSTSVWIQQLVNSGQVIF